MSDIFSEYNVALLDVSFFRKPFSEEVKQGLAHTNIYVAETFTSVYGQYRRMLSGEKSGILQDNLSLIEAHQQLKTLDFATFGETSSGLNNDTWGILTLLNRLKGKFVLVTADSMLIEKTILHDMHADIYDLEKEKLIRHAEFPEYRRVIAYSQGMRWMLNQNVSDRQVKEGDDHAASGSMLYTSGGQRITLGEEIKSGLESSIYRVSGRDTLAAKVFKPGKFSSGKYQAILRNQGVNAQMEAPWANFPIELLYYDAACTRAAGFTETYTVCSGDLDANPLYLGDLDSLGGELDTKLSETIELCERVVRQVGFLKQYGFLVSDFNLGNFAFRTDGNMQMWDTDSFGSGRYFSGFCSGARLMREYDTSQKEEAMDFCTDALYQFVFSMLSLGDTAISDFSGKFKYDNVNYGARYRREFFPDNLWSLFEKTFRGEQPASGELLLAELNRSEKELTETAGLNLSYRLILNGIFSSNTEAPLQETEESAADSHPEEKKSGHSILIISMVILAVIFILLFII